MLFVSVFLSLSLGGRVILSVVVLCLSLMGFLIEHHLTSARAPLALALIPPVLAALALFLLYGASAGWIFLPFAAYHSLVVGGFTRLWGACCEGFLIGCTAAWLVRLFDQNIKRH